MVEIVKITLNKQPQAQSCSRNQFSTIVAIVVSCLLFVACAQDEPTDTITTGFLPELAQFTDVTEDVGLNFRHGAFRWGVSGDPIAMMGGGLCWLDYNNDGWLDLYAVNSYALEEAGRWQTGEGLPQNALFRNEEGHFTDVSAAAGADLQLRGNGCVAADLNLDGWTDIYITSSRVNILLWNNGDGTFTPGEEAAGLDAYGWQTSAAVGDLNQDGLPDIFVAGYVDINSRIPNATMGFPNTHYGRRDLLFLNEGLTSDGRATFREVGVEVGLEAKNFEYGLGALLTDFDSDGDLDLLVANDTNPNRLYENIPWPGGPKADPLGIGFRFAEVGHYARIDDINSGMGVASGDYDNDGRFDLVVTNMGAQLHSVYNNQSIDEVTFDDATDDIGVTDIGVGWTGWGISWADIDHDTDLDLIIANGSIPVVDPVDDVQQLQLFANLTAQGMTGLFQDLTDVAGFSKIDPLLARGSAMADYDNDGDLDIAVNSIGGPLLLLRNDVADGHWLMVGFEEFSPGALVSLTLSDGREFRCQSRAGSSYLSSEDPRCHFGLGMAQQVAELVVYWPDGSETILEDIAADQFLTVSKDEAIPSTRTQDMVDLQEFVFRVNLRDGGAQALEILPKASDEMIELGKALFWDKELSGSRDVACVTCHHPLAGTGDNLSVSIGVGGTGFAGDRQLGLDRTLIPRNATEIFNRGAAGWTTMFWDGRITATDDTEFISPAGSILPVGLENIVAVQAMFPVTSRDEMRGDIGDVDVFGEKNELARMADSDLRDIWDGLMDRLLKIPEYEKLFSAAYPEIPLEWLRFYHAANAIAAYEMSVFTYADSPWDRYLNGEENALSPEARRGAELFYGEAGCSQCHNGSLLTDQEFHNIGVPQLGPGKGDEAPMDHGRGRETGHTDDMFAFRTPPLRNVTITGPWMHNGAYATLEEAVRHHLDPESALKNFDFSELDPILIENHQEQHQVLNTLDPLVREPIQLTDQQVADLMAFLSALTSPSSLELCDLIPDSVPSGLPVDVPPDGRCK